MKILLTGFEPFGQQPINVSEKVVTHFAAQGIEGVNLQTAVLPVNRFDAPDRLMHNFIKVQPDVVISLGQFSGCSSLQFERLAVNMLDFVIPDNGGNLETDRIIHSDGKNAYFSTLPTRKMVAAVQGAGIPAQLSMSAGTFLCNQIMYETLHHIDKFNLKTRAGFIHLPLLPEQAASQLPTPPTMDLTLICRGLEAAVKALF